MNQLSSGSNLEPTLRIEEVGQSYLFWIEWKLSSSNENWKEEFVSTISTTDAGGGGGGAAATTTRSNA